MTNIHVRRSASGDIIFRLVSESGPPSINDDRSSGFPVFSQWIDETSGTLYQLINNTNGAAVWSTASGIPARAQALASPGSYPPGIVPLLIIPPNPLVPPDSSGAFLVDYGLNRVTFIKDVPLLCTVSLSAALQAGGGVPLPLCVYSLTLNGAPNIFTSFDVSLLPPPDTEQFGGQIQLNIHPGDFFEIFAINNTNADNIITKGAVLDIIEIGPGF